MERSTSHRRRLWRCRRSRSARPPLTRVAVWPLQLMTEWMLATRTCDTACAMSCSAPLQRGGGRTPRALGRVDGHDHLIKVAAHMLGDRPARRPGVRNRLPDAHGSCLRDYIVR